MKGKRTPSKASPTVAPPKRCNCPCHQGAGVMHMIPNPNPPPLPPMRNNMTYQSNYQMIVGPCPCDLNIKIQELTKEYYGR